MSRKSAASLFLSCWAAGCVPPAPPARPGVELPQPSSDYARLVLADRPAAYWPLDETIGAVAQDASGHERDARFIGEPSLAVAVADPLRTGIQLNGGPDGVRAEFDGWMNSDALTVEGWVRPFRVRYPESALLVDKGNSWGLQIRADGRPSFAFPFEPGRATSDAPLRQGDLYHLVGTFERGTMRLYVNGALAAEDAAAAPRMSQHSEPIHVGRGLSSARFEYEGSLDEVAIYDHVLSAERIRDHYEAGR
jgi:hypothetical protein